MARRRVRTGRPFPLGARWDGRGVNFAVYSRVAERVEVCFFDATGREEIRRVPLEHRLHSVSYGYVTDCGPGDLYGLRVHGPYEPAAGHRCNPNKLLIDPYAREIVGALGWSDAHYGYAIGADDEDLSFSDADDAAGMPKCRVVDDAFDWGDDAPPRIPWSESVFYEVHVKGFTQRHPDVREDLRGTYAGLASPAAIDHLRSLGVTAVELLPVHAFVDDRRLVDMGLRNYWGYNTIGFFAPDMRYSATGTLAEFKGMVKLLHAAGIEVILDVVYNHTAEGNHLGPTLSFKGIDNAGYYRLKGDEPRYYMDYTGTGNTLDTSKPAVVRMVVDSLRYWVEQMHVDGFRFDLATTLGRNRHGAFDHHSRFFGALARDPVLSQVKLIAEPWDLGEGGHRVGGFPRGWSEWNGAWRDAVRDFWCGPEGRAATVAGPLSGSSEIYAPSRRGPGASVNIVTVHDGFTLHDLVSYNGKHNEANGEDNCDGESHNRGWNCGAEGEIDDEVVDALRERQKRNLLATLFVAQGVPLLLAGDEIARTQRGNNNAYCQDNELSWLDWRLDERKRALLDFVRTLLALRREQPALRRARFFDAAPDAEGAKDLQWLSPQGHELGPDEWAQPGTQAVAMLLAGWRIGEQRESEPAPVGDSVLVLVNRAPDAIGFALPVLRGAAAWQPRIDTRTASGLPGSREAEGWYLVGGRSLAVLTQPVAEAPA
jgi:glycogen operon protein